jgi:multiphosphoryl transfer protein
MSQEVCNPVEFKFVCPLPNGLHARPASQLAEFASDFASDLSLTNLRTGIAANLKSTLAIISADVRSGDECFIRIVGTDETSASAALLSYITRDLPKSDEPLVESGSERNSGPLPRALLAAGARCHFGMGVSPGIAKGASVVVGGMTLPPGLGLEKAEDLKREERRVARAIATVRERIKVMLARSVSPAEAGVLKAHLAIVEDVSLSDKIAELIAQGRSAGQALAESGQFFMSILQKSESSYIRDRAVDIQEICYRLLEEVYGSKFTAAAVELKEPSILVAETIAPQQLLGMDRKWLEGLVLEYAGRTSHAVILARSLGIPTVVGVKDAPVLLSGERELVVDANRGLVVPNGTAAVKRFYQREYQAQQKRNEALTRNKFRPAVTIDGIRLEVAANVSSAQEVAAACANGAEGIGLFRTEMLFIGQDRAPSEEEQFAIYKEAARAAGERPVIIRTIDIGGDKPVPHLNLPAESNPFLGYRGMRIYAEHRELFRTQLRAVLRASAFGKLQIMAPMVSTIEEVIWLKSQVAQSQDELRSQNIAFDAAIPVGIMIEVPSVAFILDQLCAEVDFFSIGTNDLNQYFLAVDRDNAKVAALSSVRHPSFLRFLKHIVDGVHTNGKWVGMCGEMAGDVRNLPILVGLGLDEISASASQVPALKERISQLYAKSCKELLSRIMACTQAEQVNKVLAEDHPSESSQSLLDPNLVIVDSDSESKEEAIRELIDSLFVAGRTENADRLEEVVWAREVAYSTGLGHGFAIPHCRSDLIGANSIAVLKLQRPIEWNSLDGKPVKMVLLLAVHESDANNSHMKVLAKLARKLMNEEFRNQLMQLNDSESILSYLSQELEIPL